MMQTRSRRVRSSTFVFLLYVFLAALPGASPRAIAVETLDDDNPPGPRIFVVSDLHLGVGRTSKGAWYRTEDFRWPNALRGFLNHASAVSRDQATLVIAGDFLELWQPIGKACLNDRHKDEGCTVDELHSQVERIVREHDAELQAIKAFALRGDNRVFIIPGNHDAGLMVASVRAKVDAALGDSGDRIAWVTDGTWTGWDGEVVVEHGHQIGSDVNAFPRWPEVLTRRSGVDYLHRPWGDRFVQKIFNREEVDFSSIVDNLLPESAGVKLRKEVRSFWGNTQDVAKFIAFNLFETSLVQKVQVAGESPADSSSAAEVPPEVTERIGRKKGYALFRDALSSADPLLGLIEGKSNRSARLRQELTRRANDRRALPTAEVLSLCDKAARNYPKDQGRQCVVPTSGAAISALLYSPDHIVARHLDQEGSPLAAAGIFIYGHTHERASPKIVDVSLTRSVIVANSGAFQRTSTYEELQQIIAVTKQKTGREPALIEITPELLAPQYGVVTVFKKNGASCIQTMAWIQGETDAAGRLEKDSDGQCR